MAQSFLQKTKQKWLNILTFPLEPSGARIRQRSIGNVTAANQEYLICAQRSYRQAKRFSQPLVVLSVLLILEREDYC